MSQHQVQNNRAELKRLRSENAALRAEVAALHKVVIDAMAAIDNRENTDAECNMFAMTILDTAPEPSDDTLAAIEAQANE